MLWLLKLINPVKAVTQEIIKWKLQQLDAETEQKKIEASVNIEVLNAQKELLLSDQSNLITRSVRPLWAAAFIIYTYKIVVFDKVLGLGTTDPLDEKMWGLMMLVAGSYFFFRGSEKLVSLLTKGRP